MPIEIVQLILGHSSPEVTRRVYAHLLHIIEDTARHNGHLDILREMLDGRIAE